MWRSNESWGPDLGAEALLSSGCEAIQARRGQQSCDGQRALAHVQQEGCYHNAFVLQRGLVACGAQESTPAPWRSKGEQEYHWAWHPAQWHPAGPTQVRQGRVR